MDPRAPFCFLGQKKNMLCIKLQCISKKTLIKCLFAGMYLLSSGACALPGTGNGESDGRGAGEDPPSPAWKNISALLNTCYTGVSRMLLGVTPAEGHPAALSLRERARVGRHWAEGKLRHSQGTFPRQKPASTKQPGFQARAACPTASAMP